ncbi:MAG: alpha/beta fold hydrolase [Burkholderiaceae bacterium]
MQYRAPHWLAGAHAQTIWPALLAPHRRVAYRRERWETPDGDFIDVDFTAGGGARPDAPLVVLFHGLEGSSQSHYARATMAEVERRGWRGAVAHFRGCSGEPNRLPRAYHSGDSDEIDWVLRRFAGGPARGAPLMALGVSLGGNALLKWLGERGDDAGFVAAAAAVCAPQDLHAGAVSLARGFNRVYTRNFLATLKRKSLHKLARHPGLFDGERVRTARDFFDFDDAVTAPLHGFRDCFDYWARSSSRQFMGGIRVPTLVINALNDPFVPAHALATPAQVSKAVTLEYPDDGGHVGFLVGPPPGRLHWLPRRVLDAFAAQLG